MQQCTGKYVMILTVVVSNDIGNINLAICGFRPHTTIADTGVSVPQGGKTRHGNVAVYLDTIPKTVCREYEKKK